MSEGGIEIKEGQLLNDCVPACQEYVFVHLSEVTFVTLWPVFVSL